MKKQNKKQQKILTFGIIIFLVFAVGLAFFMFRDIHKNPSKSVIILNGTMFDTRNGNPCFYLDNQEIVFVATQECSESFGYSQEGSNQEWGCGFVCDPNQIKDLNSDGGKFFSSQP